MNTSQASGSGIEFGVYDHIEHLEGVPLDELFARRLEQIEALDRYGYYDYKLSEHHTPAYHNMAPAQNVFLAAASQRTKSIRLGAGVYVLPLHHPMRLIEEICMLDSLTGGRAEMGVGPGTRIEGHFWGQQADEESTRARFYETLDVLREGLANEELTYHGNYYDFNHLPMRLRPIQRPYPPLWYMRNFDTAAKHKMNCVVVGNHDQVEGNVRKFHKLWAQYHGEGAPNPQGRPPLAGTTAFLVLADTDEEAQAIAPKAMDAFRWSVREPRRIHAEKHGILEQFFEAGVNPNANVARERHYARDEIAAVEAEAARLSPAEQAERQRRRGLGFIGGAVAGSPQTIRTYMEEYVSTGANYILCMFQFGDLTHEQAMRSIDLFSTEVMPHFKRQPVEATLTA